MKGILYICFGDKHISMVRNSIESLRKSGNDLPVAVITDSQLNNCQIIKAGPCVNKFDNRYYKTQIHKLSPWDETLFLDADTLVINRLDEIWSFIHESPAALALDFLGKIGPTVPHTHKNPVKRDSMNELLKLRNSNHEYHNTGVILFKKCPYTFNLFDKWHELWNKFKTIDQPAFGCALAKTGISIDLLPQTYNVFNLIPNRSKALRNDIKIFHYYQDKNFVSKFTWTNRPVLI